ncbi:SusD/RagB family nutrient-binding outer membrane lipoprotein [Kriegella aquimaris]|uniref:Starch-binding associating with outer membrane n=1 Tax=Kriegella aquimaris TaxID=192904 RepID=A0A1G9R880_9FLAO|nr:SusD/RagB family nutrient-binding outer membrane lipoprotein [Kriegella aquimaris]SDM19434.1 Starch-binding associating with outer membrane [Kriegella aquimaris]
MKKVIYLAISFILLVSCDEDFAALNTDPDIGVPPPETLFTYAQKEMVTYKGGGEWYHENHQKMTWAQYLVQGKANDSDINTILPGSKYGTFYVTIMNHLNEMRVQIASLPEEEQKFYQKLVGASEILQAFFALRVTDQFGDVPYSQASDGRREGILDPNYDKQEAILDQLVVELNNAIQKMDEKVESSFDFSSSDLAYQGDVAKWIKLANAVKLRIATRLFTQNETKAREIIAGVTSDGRLFESNDDQLTIDLGGTYRGSAGADFEWKGVMWAAEPMVEFMKTTADPRIRIFYEPNGYSQETIDAFEDPATISPAIDIDNDTAVLYTTDDGEDILGYRYIGLPTFRNDPNIGIPDYYLYQDQPNTVGNNATMLSKYNRRLLQNCGYTYGGLPQAEGNYVDVMLSYAEVCFMMSEFILKGYATGDAADWYSKGIASSLQTYNMLGEKQDLILRVANKEYPYQAISETEMTDYLSNPVIQFNGVDDLEKVYIQQFLNFYRLPDEGWILSMRTGYPKYGSSLLARSPIDTPEIPFPRRIPPPEPGDLNVAKWLQANADQGFTSPRDESPDALNSQRLWWDLNNPTIGSGGN